MATTAKLGIRAKIYRNTGTFGTPIWSEVKSFSDVTVNAAWDSQEVLTRATRVKQKVKTLLGLEVTAKIQASDSGDTDYTAIRASLNDDSTQDFMILNGASNTNGVTGFRFESQIHQANEGQNPGDVLFDDIALAPAVTANPPQTVVVSAGAPVFTTLAP